MKLILASKSPRRKELLELMGYEFIVYASDIDEQIDPNDSPYEVAMQISLNKAQPILNRFKDSIIIGADTIVYCDGQYLEKPKNAEDAQRMLNLLSGKTHQVITGVTILSNCSEESFYSATDVTFYELTSEEIKNYINSGEPYDKAGGYGIQGAAAKFVKHINGDFFTVVGLPVAQLYQRLKKYS